MLGKSPTTGTGQCTVHDSTQKRIRACKPLSTSPWMTSYPPGYGTKGPLRLWHVRLSGPSCHKGSVGIVALSTFAQERDIAAKVHNKYNNLALGSDWTSHATLELSI